MAVAFPPAKKGIDTPPPGFLDDEGFDTGFEPDVIRLLQENARLRTLVTQLSCLVLKHFANQK